jgi:hypothetical protein
MGKLAATINPPFYLIDSLAMSKIHPTWWHPSDEELRRLKKGDTVKIGLVADREPGEHFWAIIEEVDGDKLTVSVDNDLVFTAKHGVKDDDYLVIDRMTNIFNIFPK